MRVLLYCFVAILSFNMNNFVCSQIVYNEATNGDLGEPATPTNLGSAGVGVNTVTGLLNNSVDFDPDAFMFTITSGMQLDSLSFTSLSGTGNQFFAFNNGPLSTFSGAGNLISTLINNSHVGTNILSGSLNSAGGSGLSGGPLGPGDYYVWFQETGGTDHNYSISIVTSVPEPSVGAFLFAMGLGVFGRRRRT